MGKEVEIAEIVSEEPKSQQQGTSLEQATVEQLKVAAFDCDQQMKGLQNFYQTIMQELQKRTDTKEGV